MKPSTNAQIGERRGLYCPRCDGNLGRQYVAQSYPSPAGQFRRRICECGADVETTETVTGLTAEIIDATGLDADQLRMIRAMLATFRRENGRTIEMRHVRLPAEKLSFPEPQDD